MSTHGTVANEEGAASVAPTAAPNSAEEPKTRLVDIPVDGQNAALNLMIAFISVAQKRGVFSVQESSKLWECIQKFTTDGVATPDV